MTTGYYFWHEGQVKAFSSWPGLERVPLRGAHLYALQEKEWGRVLSDKDTWENIPKEAVSKEFLTVLLLLGVP